MNTVVFHPWASLAADTDNPVELRIDLDPQPGTGIAEAIPAAHELRAVLREAGLEAFIKTSGNRGLHVFCPIVPEHEFLDGAARGDRGRAGAGAADAGRVTTAWWKEQRGERIFVDFNQANRDRTMAGAYSPRALPGATVSTPIDWDELDDVDPARFTVRTIPQRLSEIGDPWARMQEARGGSTRCSAGGSATSRTASARCRSRPSSRRCRASRRACSPARRSPRTGTRKGGTRRGVVRVV